MDTPTAGAAPAADAARLEAFTFGDPVPVMDRREILDYVECWLNGRWYEPPVSWEGLATSFRAAVHHSSAIYFKRNVIASTFIEHPLLDRATFSAWVLDFLIFGNAYLERRGSRTGRMVRLQHALAKYVRRGADLDDYFFVRGWRDEHQFDRGTIHHLREADIHQEVYGLPEYLSALQSAWLNESATLFRRKYYNNGSHAGFILYISDPAQQQGDIDAIRQALRDSKGPGNFRNLFLYSPNGKKDGIQLIPVSEVAAKDEFLNIKAVSRDDMLAAHRIPPQLLGIVPGNTGGFGAVLPAAKVFARNEIRPLQERLRAVNAWLGEDVISFEPYVVDDGEGDKTGQTDPVR
ncbi:phage portal protein [Rubrivivax gelatinosus]|uniref:PBSX family phage portal protein n=1 Tax=Rubrivivax gelatinosus TaxID=28068 RepID=A0A4R2MG12_RUBGE|nr:phage portal protein [Rubrivivax gelatinosus]MBK1686185.1 phage portal protein [Rubrivivax gelatinosus]TCP05680.1 PBSX family phage portal protein [Rubrivivax gelatinosus]